MPSYDAIGNPLDDGERKYTWGAGRQLQKVVMTAKPEECMNTTDGYDESTNARLKIVFDGNNVLLNEEDTVSVNAKVFIGEQDITDDFDDASFVWSKTVDGMETSNWKIGKIISISSSDLSGNISISCSVSPSAFYGTVQVDNSLMATHTPSIDDANDVFSVVNGDLMLSTNDAVNQYAVVEGNLVVAAGLNVALTAAAVVYAELPEKVVEFKYNAEGIRIQKKCTIDNMVTTTDYVVHGEIVTEVHIDNTIMHFYYDNQPMPVMIDCNGELFTYTYNLQGDIVAIVDFDGNPVIVYEYDAWGNPVKSQVLTDECSFLANGNPFRYRAYIWDDEIDFYYVQSRYYNAQINRFINSDNLLGSDKGIFSHNIYQYCRNNSVVYSDPTGHRHVEHAGIGGFGGGYVGSLAGGGGGSGVSIGFWEGLFTAILASLGISRTEERDRKAREDDETQEKKYTVYILGDPITHEYKYVGRVTNAGYNARMAYHYRTKGLTPLKVKRNLTKLQARGLEHIMMFDLHVLKPEGRNLSLGEWTFNRIKGIADTNKNRDFYLSSAAYLNNWAEDEFLNLFDSVDN